MFQSVATITEFAPAKVNLTLRVLGRRPDGYHEIESLVAFASVGDDLAFTPGEDLDLIVDGPNASSAGPAADNLVVKVARLLASRIAGLRLGRFVLTKRLPVAAGLGGGSADAAAALRLLARANSLGLDDPRLMEAARATGADVPVCLDPRPRIMGGIGDILSAPLDLPTLHAVLVNPGVALATKDVFAAFDASVARHRPEVAESPASIGIAALAEGDNDLEPPAIALQPIIAEVLAALRATQGCRLARMSGSGATCFCLFDTEDAAAAGAENLKATRPDWWVCAATLG